MKKRKTIRLQGLMLNELQGRVDELEAELQELREDLNDEPVTFHIVKSDPAPVPEWRRLVDEGVTDTITRAAAHQIRFTLHEEEGVWWAESDDLLTPREINSHFALANCWSGAADTLDEMKQLCREAVEFVTGRPHTESTLMFLYAEKDDPE